MYNYDAFHRWAIYILHYYIDLAQIYFYTHLNAQQAKRTSKPKFHNPFRLL